MAFLSSPALRIPSHTAHRVRPLITQRPPMPFSLPRFRMSSSTPTAGTPGTGKMPAEKDARSMTADDWRKVLSRQEFNILREKGTERPGSGEYDGFYPKEGHFACRGCGNPIYSAEAKFQSGCGWPAFDKCYKGSIRTETDASLGMKRVEIMCGACDGHLGHVFEGEGMTPTNERHCVNSVSIKFVDGKVEKEEVKVV
ncbi:unnamed protein product [Chondrus crispus]|uniref:Peptide-methionine (R)-S-oxide reductase n=1 Tax=Chondrus crispus TaxID=2769 RepID=R7QFE0_CHOCR|nr:unnamed protein product [Chondrus crispus]CDF37242.1 unnamed protein product [Chondrus crispus]|eukprot:XP_005717061.1 unnamed protein product [Chondrus crispus]